MRSLGQSVGILWKSFREPVRNEPEESEESTPAKQPRREVVDREVKRFNQGNVTLRETRIREIEYNGDDEAADDVDDDDHAGEGASKSSPRSNEPPSS